MVIKLHKMSSEKTNVSNVSNVYNLSFDDEYMDISTPLPVTTLPSQNFLNMFEGFSSYFFQKIDIKSIPVYITTDLP